MKLTKKIVSLVAVIALFCTFAVSAAPTVAINGDIAEDDGTYSVNLTASELAETAQYTVLVYRVGDNGLDLTASASFAAPSSSTITYINQDAFSAISANDAYTIAFALGAIKTDGVYRVVVGGTGIATAAEGFFEVGGAADLVLGDVDGDGLVTTLDASAIVQHVLGFSVITDAGVLAAADFDADTQVTTLDASAIVQSVLGFN